MQRLIVWRRGVSWRWVAAAVWLTLNALMLLLPITFVLLSPPQAGIWHDWMIWQQVSERVAEGRLYEPAGGYYFVFSPLAGWILAAIVPLGYPLWWSLHLGVLPLLRDWRLIVLTTLSVGFWIDTMIGSTVTFIFIAGVVALRGSRTGSLIYLALFLLMPRPVHLPLAAWLVWRRPELRWPFAGLLAVVAGTTVASGYTFNWLENLLWVGQNNYGNPGNFSPTRVFGGGWLVLGVPLAIALTVKGKVGLAGLAMTPYLGAPYLLNALWDLTARAKGTQGGHVESVSKQGPVPKQQVELFVRH